MGSMNIKLKIMPSSPETDLEGIKEKAKKVIEDNEGKNPRFEEEPIAFGLKAVIITFIYSEEKSLDPLENELREIENVSSSEIIDMRRTIG